MKKLLFTFIFLFTMIGTINAQQTANVNATANVYSPLSLTVVDNLDFGGLVAGESKTITNDNVGAGVVQVEGPTGVGVDISFTLPSNLSDGTNDLPVSFGTTSAGYNVENNTSGITDFDPNSGATNISLDGTTGDLFVYIGGTVTAGGSQATGTYTETIVVTVNYN